LFFSSSGGIRTHSISASKAKWSASCLPSRMCPDEESNLESRGFKPSRSADWRTWALWLVVPDGVEPSFPVCRTGVVAVGPRDRKWTHWESHPDFKLAELVSSCWTMSPSRRKPWDSNPQAARGRRLCSRQAPDPAGWLPCGHEIEFRGLESNQRPPHSECGVATSSYCPGVREGGFEPPPPDSKSGSLPLSRFPRAPRGSRTRLSDLGSPRLTARPGTHQSLLGVRDRGVEPRSPGWKPGVVPLDQSRGMEAEGEGVEPSRLIARPDSSRVPSPFGLPFRILKLRRQESNLRPPG
jgi:hypothetical protein